MIYVHLITYGALVFFFQTYFLCELFQVHGAVTTLNKIVQPICVSSPYLLWCFHTFLYYQKDGALLFLY